MIPAALILLIPIRPTNAVIYPLDYETLVGALGRVDVDGVLVSMKDKRSWVLPMLSDRLKHDRAN